MTMTVGEAFDRVFGPDVPMRVEAYDGSVGGRPDGRAMRLTKRGLNYVITSPGTLGMARAYLMGDLEIEGMNEADPYDVLRTFEDDLTPRRPSLRDLPDLAAFLKEVGLRVPELPREETPGPLRRLAHGLRHGRRRDAEAISHHYDVSNTFYEKVLGPSMTYTCACYPSEAATLEEAQAHKYDLVARKLGLAPGMRLLDVGCGWGGMVRHAVTHYGVTALGVTLSRAQAQWATARIEQEGLAGRAEVRHADYRDVTERGFDAVSSIGLTEHIGVANYPAYFRFLRDRLRYGGRLLNHCITRPDNRHPGLPSRGFINRYVFPDGELTGSGDIVRAMEDQGFEVRHQENLREHYALTTAAWCANLSAHWDECVADAGLGIARVWGLYLAGSRLSFERNRIQLHQVLASRTGPDGRSGFPLRPTWEQVTVDAG
ncbi:MAG TPA: cyclopropane-fatty-acyl-phospholipid synthase family protein [Intrasporangium sp.]|uniref:cyclopropane-fatty-acyl-phospholipid synthase family protein n=1 Tax=Intrasporangium sp. TaxID=1925024 RepID=UPI002D798812|nr:cyclopropane-fatty-acyl-phospholipid synthase family protein [Intrasporangium sp.]HET7398175.1 cyclopropane-fatty-acyl-phospholipid synthase family protein [Intrasporangium sp.]